MKITKVNYVHAGIVREQDPRNGKLYKYEGYQSGKDTGIEAHIRNRVEASQKLFSILNPDKKESDDKNGKESPEGANQKGAQKGSNQAEAQEKTEEEKKAEEEEKRKKELEKQKNIHDFIRGSLKTLDDSIKKACENAKEGSSAAAFARELDDLFSYRNARFVKSPDSSLCSAEEFENGVQEFVDHYVRRPLTATVKSPDKKRSIDLNQVAYRLFLLYMTAGKDEAQYNQRLSEINQEDRNAFYDRVLESYTKEGQIERLVTSISNKTVPVAVNEIDGHFLLQPANAEQKKNKDEYSAHHLFDFMKEYCGTDENGRDRMVSHIRYLIACYFYGKSTVDTYAAGGCLKDSFKGLAGDGSVSMYFSEELHEKLYEKSIDKDGNPNPRKFVEVNGALKPLLKEAFKKRIIDCNMSLSDPRDKYWILEFISKQTEKELDHSKLRPEDLNNYKLSKTIMNSWRSYISDQYISMGKAVYHFVMGKDAALSKRPNVTVSFKDVKNEFTKGITSFEYERISAAESLDRASARYITFAYNNFRRAVLKSFSETADGDEDILNITDDNKIMDLTREDSTRCILQFFGGASTWPENIVNKDRMEFLHTMMQGITYCRNNAFHFSVNSKATEMDPLGNEIFEYEKDHLGQVLRKQYYSNNVPMFYAVKDIDGLMDYLYQHNVHSAGQIPSFRRLFKSGEELFMSLELSTESFLHGAPKETFKKLWPSFYFVCKEIYYYGFLNDNNARNLFLEAVADIGNADYDKKHQNAMSDFTKRINGIAGVNIYNTHKDADPFVKVSLPQDDSSLTLDVICQTLMTEYEQQNNGKTVIAKFGEEKKFKHYRDLLYSGLALAFVNYLKRQAAYAFLLAPKDRTETFAKLSEEEFTGSWNNIHVFDHFLEKEKILSKKQKQRMKGNIEAPKEKKALDSYLTAWYLTAHFLSSRQLNLLVGAFRSYIQYKENIEWRAATLNHGDAKYNKDVKGTINTCKSIVEILELVRNFSGKFSNEITDYFTTEDEYAEYVGKFVDLGEAPTKDTLLRFANTQVLNGQKIGIYADAENLIMLRGIAIAKMFGNADLLAKCWNKITFEEYEAYYEQQLKLTDYYKNGRCTSEEELKDLLGYQKMKNRLELYSVSEYTEILNDLYSQLVSWSYLRERDFMYMLLGYHYIELYYTDRVPENDLSRRMTGSCVLEDNIGKHSGNDAAPASVEYFWNITDGAILYEILAANDRTIPLVKANAKKPSGFEASTKGTIGSRYGNIMSTFRESAFDFTDGLDLFVRTTAKANKVKGQDEYDDCVSFRNAIDHFKYFSKPKESMVEMYRRVYDEFFTYDVKLRKSVSFIFKNILADHFVVADTAMRADHQRIYNLYSTKKDVKPVVSERKSCGFSIKDSLKSMKFTYKFRDVHDVKDKVYEYKWDETFLNTLQRILEYSEPDPELKEILGTD